MNDWEIIIAYWKESEQVEVLANKYGLFHKITGVFVVVAVVQPQKNFAIFILI